MSSRFASTLAAHAGFSATSILRSAFGPSEPPPSPSPSSTISDDLGRRRRRRRHRPPPHRCLGDDDDAARVRAALPWLDHLHVLVADLYASGGGEGTDYRRRPRVGRRSTSTTDDDVAAVRLARDVSFEDPIVRHAGASEVERAFRGRLRARPWGGDVKTVLEFVEVEASDEGICGGGGGGRAHRHPLLDISPSPPKVVVTYRLS